MFCFIFCCIRLGQLGIIDHDVVELNNMHRQVRLGTLCVGNSFFFLALICGQWLNGSTTFG